MKWTTMFALSNQTESFTRKGRQVLLNIQNVFTVHRHDLTWLTSTLPYDPYLRSSTSYHYWIIHSPDHTCSYFDLIVFKFSPEPGKLKYTSSVTQGSVLGPIFFNIYTQPVGTLFSGTTWNFTYMLMTLSYSSPPVVMILTLNRMP